MTGKKPSIDWKNLTNPNWKMLKLSVWFCGKMRQISRFEAGRYSIQNIIISDHMYCTFQEMWSRGYYFVTVGQILSIFPVLF